MTTSTEQRLISLDRANKKRRARSALKRSLTDGELTFRQALADPVAGGMVVWDLLKAKRGVGADAILRTSSALARRRAPIGYHARIEKLTERQKLALLEVVETRGQKPKPRAKPKPVRLKRVTRAELVAAREAAQVAVENPPPRCTDCKAQLLAESTSGLCGFCVAEVEVAA